MSHLQACDQRFKTKKILQRHFVKNHSEQASSCDLCDRKFYDQTGVDLHKRITKDLCSLPSQLRTGSQTYECNRCRRNFPEGHKLARHQRLRPNCKSASAHPIRVPEEQARQILASIDLQRKVNGLKNPQNHECSVCGKKYTNAPNLKRHFNEQHGTGEHICKLPECGMKFKGPLALERHVKEVHLDPLAGNYECCGFKYKNLVSLKSHQRSAHLVQEVECEICGKKCKNAVCLRRHVIMSHREREPFSCERCGKKFREKSSLTRHLQIKVPCTPALSNVGV